MHAYYLIQLIIMNPRGVRRKGYSKVRLLAWALEFDKFGFVRCQTTNCKFMAFDFDEIQQHYSNCFEPMDESKLFMCRICGLGSTNKNLLNNHTIRYHQKVAEENCMNEYTIFYKTYKKISKITKDGWLALLEQKGYIKCVTLYCNYLTDSLSEMEAHYGHCYQWYKENQSCFSCVDCDGKMTSIERMMKHIADCHPPGTTRDSPRNNIPLSLIDQWTDSINVGENIFCRTFGCKFMSDNVDELKRHYRFCRSPDKDLYSTCPVCSNWCEPSKLVDHLKKQHGDTFNLGEVQFHEVTNMNSFNIIEPDALDEEKIEETVKTEVIDDEDFPMFSHRDLKQYKPSTKKAQLNVQPLQVPEIVHSANIDLERKSESHLTNKVDLNLSCVDLPDMEINKKTAPNRIQRKRKKAKLNVQICQVASHSANIDLEQKNEPNSNEVDPCRSGDSSDIEMDEFEKTEPNKIQRRKQKTTPIELPKIKKTESILDTLGSKIMEEQSVSSESLVPIEITVDNVKWNLNVPPPDIAQKVVERERLSLNKMIEASLKEAGNIFYWSNTKRAILSPIQEHNPLKRKILDLKRTSRSVIQRPRIEPTVINLDNPSDISNILKKYANVVSNEEERIINSLVSDVETALEDDEYDLAFLANAGMDF